MTISILWLFLTVPWVGIECVIVVCRDHTHFFTGQFKKMIKLYKKWDITWISCDSLHAWF